ncbi:MAG: hypothetical protein WCB70_20560, partial [Xanthobacteraceae bacterium]
MIQPLHGPSPCARNEPNVCGEQGCSCPTLPMSLLENWSQELKRIDHPSPNFSDKLIPVEYVVIHYTACSLERTLEI